MPLTRHPTPLDPDLQQISELVPSPGAFLKADETGWKALSIAVADIPDLDAGVITSGKLDNARIKWDSPGEIGAVVPPKATLSDLAITGNAPDLYRLYIRNIHDGIPFTELCLSAGPGLEQSVFFGLVRYLYAKIDNQSGGPFLMGSGANIAAIFYPSGGTSLGQNLSDPGANNLRVQGNASIGGTLSLGSFTVSTVPSAGASAGSLIYVVNEAGGATIAFSDGTSWRRIHDRQVIS